MSSGHNLQPLPPGSGDFFNPKTLAMSSWTILDKMAISKFLLDPFCEIKTREGGVSFPPITLALKKGLELLITNPMSPLRSLCDHPFFENLICPQGHNFKPLPWGLWGKVHSQTRFQDFSTLLNKMAISKFWRDVFGLIMGVRGWYLPSNPFQLLKRALFLSICNWMSPFWSFYDNFYTKWPGLKKTNNNK